jgi:hypothetical protein
MILHVPLPWRVMLCMNKVLFASLLVAGATALLLAQQSRPAGTAPGRIATGGSSQSPMYAPYELLSVFPEYTAAGEYQQVDPSQLQSLADQGWQLVNVSPYVYRNEGHDAGANDPAAPPPPLVTQVYLAYFFQRARLMH